MPKDENDTSVRSTVISVYNTFSSIEDEFRDRLVRKIQKKEGTEFNALEDAQELADMTKARNDAFSLLIDATTMSLLTARPVGMNADVADTWKFTCVERTKLIDEIGPDRGGSPKREDFEKVSGMIRSILLKHPKCS